MERKRAVEIVRFTSLVVILALTAFNFYLMIKVHPLAKPKKVKAQEKVKLEEKSKEEKRVAQLAKTILHPGLTETMRSAFRETAQFNYTGPHEAFVHIDLADFLYMLSNQPLLINGINSILPEVVQGAFQDAIHDVLLDATKIQTGKTYQEEARDKLCRLASIADYQTQKEFYVSMIGKRPFYRWIHKLLISDVSDDVKIEGLKRYRDRHIEMSIFIDKRTIPSLHKILASDTSPELKELTQSTLVTLREIAEKREIEDFQRMLQHVKRNALLYIEKKHISEEKMENVLGRLEDTEIERHIENIRTAFGATVEVDNLRQTLKEARDQYKDEIESILEGPLTE